MLASHDRNSRVVWLVLTLATTLASTSEASAQTCYIRPLPRVGDTWHCASSCGRTTPHAGVDFPAASGTGIPAIADGTAIHVPSSSCLGNVLVIAHPDGMFSGYSHLSAIHVANGQAVSRGQIIAAVGNTGTCTTGPHLHLTLGDHVGSYYDRANVDPIAYIDSHSVCSCDRSAGRFTFSCDGPNAGAHCVSVDEPGDPDSWSDNYLCSASDVGFRWSTAGPIDGMRCAMIQESADPHAAAWADNHACAPDDAPFELLWSNAGAIDGWQCVHFNETADPGTWNDNFLCARDVSCFSAGGFTFCGNGPPADMTCVSVNEPGDPDTWSDNYFCSTGDIGMVWSIAGPIDGMTCTNVHESADAHAAAWADNYLCLPPDADYELTWSSAGRVAGMTCVRWYEAADLAGTWGDNYLCVREVVREVDAGAAISRDASVADGAVIARDGATSTDASSIALDGSTGGPGAPGLRSGCGCRAGRGTSAPWPMLAAMMAIGLLARTRRRRRARG